MSPDKKNYILELLSDFWIASGKVVSAISLIILPLITVIYVYTIHEILKRYLSYDRGLHTFVSPIPWLPTMATFLTPFEIVAFFLIIMLYPPYPAPYPIKWYFQKRGFVRAVKEYRLVIYVLYITTPLLISFTDSWSNS